MVEKTSRLSGAVPTYHLHIQGRVQGVGFRPHVYKLANDAGVVGSVRNDTDGVHVLFNSDGKKAAREFAKRILEEAPSISIIKNHELNKVPKQDFRAFEIAASEATSSVRMLITPDLGICASCRSEVLTRGNRRHLYPFITCTQCGPRFSIINTLPYDRDLTTMDRFEMCPDCFHEYNTIQDRRHYSQTNSCPVCPVHLSLIDNANTILSDDPKEILTITRQLLLNHKIVGIKGIGGYLLMADATDSDTVQLLRHRKRRPAKPFAVMYPSIDSLKRDVEADDWALNVLTGPECPILLLPLKKSTGSAIASAQIAPGLKSLGVMLPYTGLYQILLNDYPNPVVATSGNLSDSPIIYRDEDVLSALGGIADYFITNDRDIVVPQDDSVWRYSPRSGKSVVIRRSRGMAPSIKKHPFLSWKEKVFAAGADLKSSFGLHHNGEVYLSQYMGNLEYAGSQESYRHTLAHFMQLLDFDPDIITTDMHPLYFSSLVANDIASDRHARMLQVQHHIAHFAAVLGEHDLLNFRKPVLGVIFDGTGYGPDGNIWGGEFFSYVNGKFTRVGHLKYFDHLTGDKMAREPRLSAYSILQNIPGGLQAVKPKFSSTEWDVYSKMDRAKIQTSSMGRVFDAIASLLGLCDIMLYEGQAAMLLEQLATEFLEMNPGYSAYFPLHFSKKNNLVLSSCITNILEDIDSKVDPGEIALKFHNTLVMAVGELARKFNINNIAFSGGVFQNALLVEQCRKLIDKKMTLYFHNELSPNDENIAFGQLVYSYINRKET